MRRLLFITSLVILAAGLTQVALADLSPAVTAIGLSGNSSSLDSTVGPGETIYVVGEFDHDPDSTMDGVYYNTSTGVDKIILLYYSASPPSGASFISQSFVTPTNVAPDNGDSSFTFQFTVPSGAPGNTQSMQILFGCYGFEYTGFDYAYGTRHSSYLQLGSTTPVNDPVNANHVEYMVFEADNSTEAPTLTTPAASARDNQNFNIAFTLPEAALSGSVKLVFVETGGASAPFTDRDTLTLTSTYQSAGSHSFTLTGQDLNSQSSIVASESGNFGALVDSSLYTVEIRYQDAAGNPVASDNNTNILYDNDTYPSTFVTPAGGGQSSNSTVAVDYTLPEAASYVQLYLERTSGTIDNASPHTLTLYSGGETQGQHQFNLIGNNIGTNSPYVDANPWGAVDSLVQECTYRVYLKYKDELGNDEEQVVHHGWTYYADTVTETPTLSDPTNGDRDNNSFSVAFILPEPAAQDSVWLRFTRTGGTADPANYHEMRLNVTTSSGFSLIGNNLISTSEVTAVTGEGSTQNQNNTLVNGAIYSVVVKYRDTQGNAVASSDTATNVTFDNSTSAPTLDTPANSTVSGSPITMQYDQPEDAQASSLKLTFTRTGGTIDAGSPHILTLSNTSSGTDKTLSVIANNLSGTTGVSSVSGGNSLVNGTIYTVKIEYQDDLGNAAAYDENTNFTYSTGVIVYAVGDDVNEGVQFQNGSLNNPIFQLRLNTNTSTATMSSLTFTTSAPTGSIEPGDIQTYGSKLWLSTDDTFDSGSDTQIATITNFAIGAMTFSGLSESITTSYVYYFFTIDIGSAESGDQVLATIESSSDINVGSATVSGDFPMGGTAGHPLPVELISFEATPGYGSVTLDWTTASETNNDGFNLYRSTAENGNYTMIASHVNTPELEGQGTIPTSTHYTYVDYVDYIPGVRYYYKLESVDILGNVAVFEGIASVVPFEPIADYRLEQNYPNPFNPITTIPYQLKATSKVTIKVYDLLGREVTTLLDNEVQPMGRYSVRWDGTSNGVQVASGTYFYRIQANHWDRTQRMILLR